MSDREFMKLFSGLIGALVALTVVLFILAQILGAKTDNVDRAKVAADTRAVAERIKPVGELATGDTAPRNTFIAAANAAGEDKGKAVFDANCAACHGTGVAGAPKLGDKAAWKERVAKGNATLYEHALKGFQGKAGVMPPKGGNVSLPDADVKAAVDYMVGRAK